jgi:RimJ/RimL family protein N-acetyltransferase
MFFPSLRTSTSDAQITSQIIMVKELHEQDRAQILKHFLTLKKDDRYLRFGSYAPDDVITKYVEKIDFSKDVVFGVYDHRFHLQAAGHLAFIQKNELPREDASTENGHAAEFGLSVSPVMRGMGVGTKLFERAAIHCKNKAIDTLYVHCLSSNATMMHIAKKSGMSIHRSYGEADAYLKIVPATVSSLMQEAFEEQFASFDYNYKANKRAVIKLFSFESEKK